MISAQQFSSGPEYLVFYTGLMGNDTIANPAQLLQFVPITIEVLEPVDINIFLR